MASPTGFEPVAFGLGKRCACDVSDCETGHLHVALCSACRSACRSLDPHLASLVTAWPSLPEELRLAILALVAGSD